MTLEERVAQLRASLVHVCGGKCSADGKIHTGGGHYSKASDIPDSMNAALIAQAKADLGLE